MERTWELDTLATVHGVAPRGPSFFQRVEISAAGIVAFPPWPVRDAQELRDVLYGDGTVVIFDRDNTQTGTSLEWVWIHPGGHVEGWSFQLSIERRDLLVGQVARRTQVGADWIADITMTPGLAR